MGICSLKKQIIWFVVNSGLIVLLFLMMEVYTGAAIRTLERRFGLSSQQSGLIISLSDVTHVTLAVFIGYFGRRAHKPKVISIAVFISSFGGFMMAAPHFVLPFQSSASSYVIQPAVSEVSKQFSYESASFRDATNNLEISTASGHELIKSFQKIAPTPDKFCRNSTDLLEECLVENKGLVVQSVHPAYYIFIIAQLIIGIGSASVYTLGLAYIDENSSNEKSSFYIGILGLFYTAGPVCGLMMAATTLKLPENLGSGQRGSPKDPTWIGNWWLGYVIGSSGSIILSVSMWFFPANLSSNTPSRPESARQNQGILEQTMEFPKRLRHLLTNTAFLINMVSVVCGTYLIVGVYKNIVRYVEIHFMEQAHIGSVIAAVVLAVGGAVGGLGGGLIMSRLKLSPVGAVRIILASDVFVCFGLIVILFLKCPQLEVSGQISNATGLLNITNSCNSDCSCLTDGKAFSPVCGSDGLTYFSSCFAGCTGFENKTFTDCGCLAGPDKWTKPGFCKPDCPFLIPYAITLFVMTLIGALSRVPATVVNLRIVDDEERSFALGIKSFVNNLLGFIPGPILFGSLIDSTCRLWQSTCGKTGACLLFDTAKFRNVTYGTSLGFQFLDVFCVVVLLILLVRSRKFSTHEQKEKDAENNIVVSLETDDKREDESSEVNGREL